MKELNFEESLVIDEANLDKEWLHHASNAAAYVRMAVEARKELRDADQRLKLVRSQLILKASNPETCEEVLGKGVKGTMQTIEAGYRVHPLHQKAKAEYLEALEKSEYLDKVMELMNARKSALENLVRLNGTNYFLSPREPREITRDWKSGMVEAREKEREVTQDRIKESINSRRK